MREVPAKPLPDTLQACHREIRRITRDMNSERRLATILEDRLVEQIGKTAQTEIELMQERRARYQSACESDPMLVKISG